MAVKDPRWQDVKSPNEERLLRQVSASYGLHLA
jgi:hypothetical protein